MPIEVDNNIEKDPGLAVVQSGKLVYAADSGSTDAYAITLSPIPATLTTGMVVNFKANTANTGTATLNVNGLGAVAIKKNHDQDLVTGDIEASQIVTVVYDGTYWQMQSQNAVYPSGDTLMGTEEGKESIWYSPDGDQVITNATQTLTNKTLTSPGISGGTVDDAVLRNVNDSEEGKESIWYSADGDPVETNAVQTLTNKTFVAPVLGTPASGDLQNCTAGTTSAKGVLELATNAEALTGTDTERAITPDDMTYVIEQKYGEYDLHELVEVPEENNLSDHITDASTSHAITDPSDTPVDADALRDDLVTNTIPAIETALNNLGTKINSVLTALETAGIVKTS